MINAIKDIGKYLRENNGITEEDIIRSLVTPVNSDKISEIMLIDIGKDKKIKIHIEEFYNDIVTKSLFYQVGNGALGGALRADYFKDEKKERAKFDKKIKSRLSYCGKEEFYDEVKKLIYERIEERGKNFFVVILVDNKYPYELFKDKFLDKMYNTMFKQLTGKHVCHFCGEKSEVYNTTTFKFYTNDKEIYGTIDENEKYGVTMCKQCLNDVLIGKKYVEETLTTYWLDSSVMFLPHNFNDITEAIYDNSSMKNNEDRNMILNIREDEKSVLERIGKGDSETDIIFYKKEAEKTFNIHHSIKSLLPSRFGYLAQLLDKYKLKLFEIIFYCTAIEVGLDGIETTSKEKFKIVDSIFTGKKINRNIFFSRVMKVYKHDYIKDSHKFTITNIGKIYNFLVNCKCLKGGFDVMVKYKNYKELFDKNEGYFDNEKKAWFLIGMLYSYINYKIKDINSTEEGKLEYRSSLDKNFFFARKFDFRDFIRFSNLLNDNIAKYKISSGWIEGVLTEAKELMANENKKLSTDEAKYNFFWGMDSYFKREDDVLCDLD